jgi:hypothetical protein
LSNSNDLHYRAFCAEVVSALHEPRRLALIACQIQTGPGRTWTNRTYAVERTADGQWLIYFGGGARVLRSDWNDVLDWLRRLCPRDIELLEAP